LTLRCAALGVIAVLAGAGNPVHADSPEPAAPAKWTAEWITHPAASLRDAAVFHFRKVIHLDTKPDHFWVEASADNRFTLRVNGERMGEGPAKGDLQHWRYETLDLAPALHTGENVIAATVWNFGPYTPLAIVSDRTAFLLQGNSAAESVANTNSTWQVEEEKGESFIPRVGNGFMFYWAADPGEKLDAGQYDWDWMQPGNSSRSNWVAAGGPMRGSIYPSDNIAVPAGVESHNRWFLVPDTLPQMEFREVETGKVVRTNRPDGDDFPAKAVTIPPNTTAEILLQRQTMVAGFPELEVSGGSGAHISIGYTEALYDEHNQRANRNEVGNRRVLGLFDEFLPDGGANRRFMPLWPRTWRYLELQIKTGDAPLTLNALRVYFSAYPFEERAKFDSSDLQLSRIWDICWRTARLGARETYMDTPFWEQLQYIDDSRVQALISYTVAGDDRLAKQALHAFDDSRIPEGLTQSRYPSSLQQFIPNFSLSYIDMLHDYWMYRTDQGILKELVPRTRPILEWFFEREREDGFLEKLPYWNAIDSPRGVRNFPRTDAQGRSALMTLLFVQALQDAADLEDAFGDKSLAIRYRSMAARSAKAVYDTCWNPQLNLLADSPDRNSYSQHTNIYGILTDAIPHDKQAAVLNKILSFKQGEKLNGDLIALVSYHYQFYLSRAIDKADTEQQYLSTLEPWRGMLKLGLTTTPEYADPTRSDTHAWSAHPIYDLLTIVAGIHPAAPGFREVRISPRPGDLAFFNASMPHSDGAIDVSYKRTAGGVDFDVTLPPGLKGELDWKGREYSLHEGKQTVTPQP
jgi:hypothetical protein